MSPFPSQIIKNGTKATYIDKKVKKKFSKCQNCSGKSDLGKVFW